MEIDQEQLKIKAPLNNKKKCFKCSANFDERKKGAKDWLSCEKSGCQNWYCDLCAKKISLNDSFICENCK